MNFSKPGRFVLAQGVWPLNRAALKHLIMMLSLALGAVNSKHRGRIMLQAGLMGLWWGELWISGADGTEGSGLLLAGPWVPAFYSV